MELCGATELPAAFREESRTSFFPASAALQEIREAIALFVVFFQGKPRLAIFIRPQYYSHLTLELKWWLLVEEDRKAGAYVLSAGPDHRCDSHSSRPYSRDS